MFNNARFLISYFFIVLVLLLIFYYNISNYNAFFVIVLFFGIFLSSLIFFSNSEVNENLKMQILKHSNIFLLGYFVVHFQFYLDLILGYQSLNDGYFFNNTSVILKSMTLSFIGLICFFIGHTVSRTINRKDSFLHRDKSSTHFLISLSYIIVLYYYYSVNPLYILGGYNIYEQGAEAKYAALAFTAVVYAIFIQKIINLKASDDIPKNIFGYIKSIGVYTSLPILIYLGGVLLSGDRGPIIIFILAYLFGYLSLTKNRIKILPLLLLLFLFGNFFTILGEARKLGSELSLGEKIKITLNKGDSDRKSLIPFTRELSNSVSALHHIVNYIPSQGDYLYGILQKNEIILSVPLGSSIFNYTDSPENKRMVNSQNYITWIIQGDNPTYGNGTSLVADLYSIFGLVSIMYGMLVFGWFVRFLEITMYVKRYGTILSTSLALVFFCEILYLSRSSILGSLKIIILVLFLLYFNKLMNFFLRK